MRVLCVRQYNGDNVYEIFMLASKGTEMRRVDLYAGWEEGRKEVEIEAIDKFSDELLGSFKLNFKYQE